MPDGVFEIPGGHATCSVPAGVRLSEAAEAAGVVLNVACGGNGVCGLCTLELLAGSFVDNQQRLIHLDGQPKRVLACQTWLAEGPFRVRVPRHSLVTAGEKVVVDFHHVAAWSLVPAARKEFLTLPPPSLADQAGDIERIGAALAARRYPSDLLVSLAALRGRGRLRGRLSRDGHPAARRRRLAADRRAARRHHRPAVRAAVDVGTTTVVCALVDLLSGKIVDAASCYNQQVRRCDDVASRIPYAARPGGLAELHRLIVEATVNRLAGVLVRRHGLGPGDICRMAVSGNSVMTHLFLGIDPTSLGGVPFQPAANAPPSVAASELGLAIHPAALVDIPRPPRRTSAATSPRTCTSAACTRAARPR